LIFSATGLKKSWKFSYDVSSTPQKQTRKKLKKTVHYTRKNTAMCYTFILGSS